MQLLIQELKRLQGIVDECQTRINQIHAFGKTEKLSFGDLKLAVDSWSKAVKTYNRTEREYLEMLKDMVV